MENVMFSLPSLEGVLERMFYYEDLRPYDSPTLRAQHHGALSRLNDNTILYGDDQTAILHEQIDRKISVDYHHHDNFNTKPNSVGEKGYGGYMQTNVPSGKQYIRTMNDRDSFAVEAYGKQKVHRFSDKLW